jgi:DNA segregation ATPase FtsK/SpoIIIE-like protein
MIVTMKLIEKAEKLAEENGGLSIQILTKKFRINRKKAKTIIGTLWFMGVIDTPFCKLIEGGRK